MAKMSPDRKGTYHLYQDALRRKEKFSVSPRNDPTMIVKDLQSKNKTNRLLLEKIEKEIQLGLIQIEVHDDMERLDLTQLTNFLQIFGYARKDDEELCKTAWVIMKGDTNEGITRRGLKLLLCGINNLW